MKKEYLKTEVIKTLKWYIFLGKILFILQTFLELKNKNLDEKTKNLRISRLYFIYKKMLKIRLQRKGRKNRPFYRIVVAESVRAVQGKFVEIVGHYDPLSKEVVFKKEVVVKYLKNGAQPSQTVARLGSKNGITELESYVEKRFSHAKKEKKAE